MRIFPLLGWMLVPGCWAAVTGPGAVRGPAGGSVSVRCRYGEGYEEYHKFWCRGEWFCPDDHIAESAGTEAEVKRGRVSLRDDHTSRAFTVTLENLTAADAGTYQCGVKRAVFIPDLTHTVEVSVSPAVPRPSPTGRSPSMPEQPASPSTPKSTSTWTTAETKSTHTSTPTERTPATAEQPGDAASTPITLSVRSNNTHALAQLSNIYFLLLFIWKVPIFLCIVGVNVRYRKDSREM